MATPTPRKFFYGLDAAGSKVINVADPTADTDAANKRFVMANAGGGGGGGTPIVQGTRITITDNGDGSKTIATTATTNDTDANLKNRVNHTGQMSAQYVDETTTKKLMTDVERAKLGGINTTLISNAVQSSNDTHDVPGIYYYDTTPTVAALVAAGVPANSVIIVGTP